MMKKKFIKSFCNLKRNPRYTLRTSNGAWRKHTRSFFTWIIHNLHKTVHHTLPSTPGPNHLQAQKPPFWVHVRRGGDELPPQAVPSSGEGKRYCMDGGPVFWNHLCGHLHQQLRRISEPLPGEHQLGLLEPCGEGGRMGVWGGQVAVQAKWRKTHAKSR